MAQFPTVRMGKLTLRNMQKKFRFCNKKLPLDLRIFQKYETVFSFFTTPFEVNVVTVRQVSVGYHTLRCNEDPKSKF
jgi:hypothetical protein